MSTNLRTVFRTLLIWYTIVAKILKLHLITFFTFQTIYKKGWPSWIVSCIFPHISDLKNDVQITEILLYGKENLDNINNASILDATIIYLTETKRFDAQLFWCSQYVMALILILHLKFIFLFILFCFIFIIFIFLLFLAYFFIFYMFIFLFPGISQHIYVYLLIVSFFV